MLTSLENKRITVTGSSGFLGRNVVRCLNKLHVNISTPAHDKYDLTCHEDISHMYNTFKPDIVIHLAARVGGIGANQATPATFFYDNLMMGTQLMHEGYEHNIEKFVTVGSICSYPQHTPVPFKETDIWNGYPEPTNAPYGLSKKMLLVQSQAYRQQYGFNSIVLFPVNLYGPGDSHNLQTSHVIPAMILKMLTAKREKQPFVVLWGSGNVTREFLYVEDAAEGIILATQQYDSSEPVNLGSGKDIEIYKLAHLIRSLCEYTGDIVWDTTKPDGQERRLLNVSKAKECFGFMATTSFEDGLKRTVESYMNEKS